MRFLAVLLVFFLGFGTILVFQEPHVQAQYGGQQGTGQRQPDAGAPAWGGRGGQRPAATPGTPPVRPGQPLAGQGIPPARPGQPPVAGQGTPPVRPGQPPVAGQGTPPARPWQPPAAGQGTQPVRPGQPPAQVVERQPRPQPQPTGPLVRPFGESKTAETPVVGFGQRVPPQGTLGARGGNAGGSRQQRDAQEAQQAAVQAARNANAVRQTAAYDSLPPAVRNNTAFSWFFEYDKDQDAQLSMMEYVDGYGGTWTEGIAGEFRSLDRNGDGLVTVDEALTTIKEWDELRAKEEREKAAAAAPPGGPPPPTGRRSAPTGTQNARTPAANPNQVRQPPPGRNQGDQQNTGGRSGRGRGGGSQ